MGSPLNKERGSARSLRQPIFFTASGGRGRKAQGGELPRILRHALCLLSSLQDSLRHTFLNGHLDGSDRVLDLFGI